jgi:tRNA wybutosine-synthesizing protein 3
MESSEDRKKKKKKAPGHQVERLPEPRAEFVAERARVLELLREEKDDKSRAGGVDAAIATFVQTVNAKWHLYTTSSCAGRLIVTLNDEEPAGYGVPWLFVSHEPVEDAEAMLAAVRERLAAEPPERVARSSVWLKLEPPIVAVVCSGEAAAARLMNLGRGAAGLKRCFVIALRGDAGHVVSVSDTRRVESVLAEGDKWLADSAYVAATVRLANRKLADSRERIERMRVAIESNEFFE